MSLINLIQATGLSDTAEITAALNAATVEQRDETLKTSRTVLVTLGMDAGRLALGGLQAVAAQDPAMAAMWQALNSGGIDFSHDLTQGTIDALTGLGIWSSEIGDALKAMGRWHVSPYESWAGRGQTVTQEQVEQALAEQQPVEYDSRQMLLSLSIGPQHAALSFRVAEAAAGGRTGATLASIATGDADNVTLPAGQRAFVDSLLALVREYGGVV